MVETVIEHFSIDDLDDNDPGTQTDAILSAASDAAADDDASHVHEHFQVDSSEHFHLESNERLGVVALAVMVFYSVSGGPFGVETSVRSAGNFYTLAGFLIAPFVWSLPEALMTAELGAAFSQDGSAGVAWVEHAFGARAGWMAGYLGWVSGATDNAIYPVLFLEYLMQVVQPHDSGDSGMDAEPGVVAAPSEAVHPVLRFVLLSSTSIGLAYVNWLGLALVGRMSITICMIAMSPFIILSIVGAFKCDPSRWFELPSESLAVLEAVTDDDIDGGIFPDAAWGGVLWRPFLNSLFWNLNSFDSGASFVENVDGEPGHVFPRAMLLSFAMVVVGYLVPLLVALGATNALQHEWVDGYFARAASEIVGPWLGGWTVFAAGISNIAQFQAELSADAFQLMGMADRGYVPKIFTRRSQYGTPTYGILLGTAVIVVMGVSHLDQLIEMLNFNYALALLLEYSAFVKLRLSRPDLPRPYRVPLSTGACILGLIPTFVLTFVVLGLATYTTYLFSITVNLVGLLAYAARDHDFLQKWIACICQRKPYAAVRTVAADTYDGETDSTLNGGRDAVIT